MPTDSTCTYKTGPDSVGDAADRFVCFTFRVLSRRRPAMISAAGLSAFWIISLLTLQCSIVGAPQSPRHSDSEPDVPFPPASPTAENLAAICNFGNFRPRYLPNFFPKNGFSHFRRRGNAINHLETWYISCCDGQISDSQQVLCCAQQAWKQALFQFCMDEYGTMTAPYWCCEEKADARWECFDREPPNPGYDQTPDYIAPALPPESGFTFNSSTC
ncbi:extracellular matrix protein 1 [Thalassophryne amazonica]|uniref:extracellular matrix protein 1 n=1 Tax=Thalassophryne amazonica TaxID=390379 RepID=UPI001470EF57|nr:extracellular matrix protein 1 [Thalassophryne amazonica]